jgi:tetratricopeptide (TPR) repeat protein
VLGVAYSKDGRWLATASGEAIILRDATTGKEKLSLPNLSDYNVQIVFSNDGRRLFATSGGWTVEEPLKVWDTESGQELLTLKGGSHAVALSPDALTLAAGGMGGITLWDARKPTREVLDQVEARDLVRALFEKPLPRTAVVTAINEMVLSDTVRRQALLLVSAHKEEKTPQRYNDAARLLLRGSGLPERFYRQALTQAQTACDLAPKDTTFLTTLGMAYHRLGDDRKAFAIFTQAEARAKNSPAVLAFLALTHARFSRRFEQTREASEGFGFTPVADPQLTYAKKAADYLQRLRQVLNDPRWTEDTEARGLLTEAEHAVAHVRERK